MKILAFEVRPDEKDYFQEMRDKYQIEIEERTDGIIAQNLDDCKGYDAVTCLGMYNIDREILKGLKERGIYYLATRTVGYNHIDVAAAKEIGIHVCHVTYAPDSVAEFTLMMMLVALRKYKPAVYRQNVNDYSLDGLIGKCIHGMTVGVMGTGQIGRAVIKLLAGFGCKVLAYDQFQNEEVKKYATYVSLEECYAKSDIITTHLPMLDSTRHIINEKAIAQMKKGVVLVNTARGELMDVNALIHGIENKQIGALALDVFEQEYKIYHSNRKNDILSNRDMAYLRQFPNVVMTQHMAFYTEGSVSEMVIHAIEGLLAMSEGKPWTMEL